MSIKSTIMPERKRDVQKRETRGRLLDAAMRVFSRGGILASSTAEISREAGLSHGSLFAHFGSKEELVATVIEGFGEALAGRLRETGASGSGTRAVLAAHLEALAEREGFYARLVAEAPLLPRRPRVSLAMIQSSVSSHLSPAVEADTRAGRLRALPFRFLFDAWIGLVHYYLANGELFAPGAPVLERRGGELLDHFMSLISKPGECP
jgi:AcrR family transcriptional regulator